MPVAAIVNGNTYAVHSDHLNTPRKLTNADGQAVWQWGYSAFGEDKPTTAKNRFANLDTTPNPGTTSISEVKFNLRYPGQYADEESGLSYNYFRSYDARTGRYSQPDPIGLGGGWNRFGYVAGNPLRYVDPQGLDTAVMIGGPTSGNPAGHVAIGFTGQGVYSSGTLTPFGSSLTDYLEKQARYRDTNVIIIPTTPEQEARMIASLKQGEFVPLPDPFKDPLGAAGDTCATRTNQALNAGGIRSSQQPPGNPLPYSTGLIAGPYGKSELSIKKGNPVPAVLKAFNPK
jgi:RHS repeat-associated protein